MLLLFLRLRRPPRSTLFPYTTALPILLVDVDTGFGASAFNVARTVKSMIKFGAAAIHIEDQVGAKRCGHRPNKEMVDRIKAAVRSEEHTSELQSRENLVCRLLLEKKKT